MGRGANAIRFSHRPTAPSRPWRKDNNGFKKGTDVPPRKIGSLPISVADPANPQTCKPANLQTCKLANSPRYLKKSTFPPPTPSHNWRVGVYYGQIVVESGSKWGDSASKTRKNQGKMGHCEQMF
jgi:hypothetical protein